MHQLWPDFLGEPDIFLSGFDTGAYIRHGAVSNIFQNLNDTDVPWRKAMRTDMGQAFKNPPAIQSSYERSLQSRK